MNRANPQPGSIVPLFDALRKKYGWRLRDVLGHGGSAHVFRESWNGVPCAVKVSKAPLVFHSDEGRKRLHREMQALRELRGHRNILRLTAHCVCLGHLITVWELAEGTLYDELCQMQQSFGGGGLFPAELLKWMREAAAGIDSLNSRGIYHRDIKPQNLFLVRGHVKVGDLGFAKFGGASTLSNSITGTLGYSPLEALAGETKPTIDVFGLAATYVHLRTGRRPFGENVVTIIERMRERDFECQGLTGDEIICLRKALSPDPDERFATASELVDRLARAAPRDRVRGDVRPSFTWPHARQVISRWLRRYLFSRRTAVLLIVAAYVCGLAWSPHRHVSGKPPADTPARGPEPELPGDGALPQPTDAASDGPTKPAAEAVARPPVAAGAAEVPSPRQVVQKEPVVIVHILPHVRGVLPPAPLSESDGLLELPFGPEYLPSAFEAAEFHPRGGRVVALTSDGLVTLWNEAGGEPLKTFSPGPNRITAVAISPHGQVFVAGTTDGTLVVCDMDTGETVRRLFGHADRIASAVFDHTGDRILSASDDRTARIWHVDRGVCEQVLRGHEGAVHFASFSPDGRRVVSASEDGTARIWDAHSGRPITVLEGHEGRVSCARFLDRGRSVITTAWDGKVRVWDAEKAQVQTLTRVSSKLVNALDVDPGGRRVAVACGETPLLWDIYDNRVRLLDSHAAAIRSIRFDSSGARLATSSWDGTIRIWDADAGKELAVLGADH